MSQTHTHTHTQHFTAAHRSAEVHLHSHVWEHRHPVELTGPVGEDQIN